MSAGLDLGTVGDRYRSSRRRVDALGRTFGTAEWELPVPACPGWRTRDVLAHLVGVTEDALAGRIAGPPSPEQTADEVDRHRTDDPTDLLDLWAENAPAFEEALTAFEIWPAFLDVLSHELDIRAAVGDRSCRDHDDVRAAAAFLSQGLPPQVEVRIDGTPSTGGGDVLAVLSTTPFELLRLRLGRRSRAQALALDWTGDPETALDALFVFGPADHDLHE